MSKSERNRCPSASEYALWTLLASCKLHGVDPFAYLRDVLTRVGSHPARDVLALSPKAWKQQLQDAQAQ